MNATAEDLTTQVAGLRKLSRRLVRELGIVERTRRSCSIGDCHTLIELGHNDLLTVGQLSHRLLLEKSTVSRKLNRLEQRGWLRAGRDGADRRTKRLRLTPSGRRQLERIDRETDARVAAALRLLGPDEQAAVQRGFALYVDALARSRISGKTAIRPIRRRDDAELGCIIRDVMAEFGLDDASCGYADAELDRMYQSYSGARAAYFVATIGGTLVGGGGIGPLAGAPADVCELRKMYLLPEARGRGLGRALLERCLAAARAAGYHSCYLETAPALQTAQKLYRAHGFEKHSERLGATGHSGCRDYYLRSLL